MVQDLLSQTTHYSEKVRRGALTGLTDLFSKHRAEAAKQVQCCTLMAAASAIHDSDLPSYPIEASGEPDSCKLCLKVGHSWPIDQRFALLCR